MQSLCFPGSFADGYDTMYDIVIRCWMRWFDYDIEDRFEVWWRRFWVFPMSPILEYVTFEFARLWYRPSCVDTDEPLVLPTQELRSRCSSPDLITEMWGTGYQPNVHHFDSSPNTNRFQGALQATYLQVGHPFLATSSQHFPQFWIGPILCDQAHSYRSSSKNHYVV